MRQTTRAETALAMLPFMLDRRGVTLSPRGSARPVHRFIYPFRADAFIRNAQDLSAREGLRARR